MKNIHVLPTDKPSRLHITGKLGLYPNKLICNPKGLCKNHNIYITNDSEIKVGDWYIIEFNGVKITKCTSEQELISIEGRNDCQKIILTTDQDLIKDGVQAIDDEFLEWFVKNPSCQYVTVYDGIFGEDRIWKKYIIIPKEEPKQEHCDCRRAYKEALSGICELCWDEKYPTKQETLEETALRIFKRPYKKDFPLEDIILGSSYAIECMTELAQWQQARMYSEEDFKLFARQYYREIKLDKSNLLWDDLADKCLEQFKKK